MDSNELKEIDSKNRTCSYFDDTIKIKDFDFDNILIDKKSYKNTLVYEISYKTSFGLKPLLIGFDEVNGFIRVYDEIRYLALFGPEKYDPIYNRIRYLISQKNDIKNVASHNYANIKNGSFDSLPLYL